MGLYMYVLYILNLYPFYFIRAHFFAPPWTAATKNVKTNVNNMKVNRAGERINAPSGAPLT